MKILLKISLFLLFFISLISQDVDVPLHIQIPIFFKILTFEKNIKNQNSKKVKILILYQGSYRESNNSANETSKLIDEVKNDKGINFHFDYQIVNLDKIKNLDSYFDPSEKNICFIMPLRAIDLSVLSGYCRANKIISFSTVYYYMEEGFSISLTEQREKPKIFINLNSVKEEGGDFSSQLLKLVTIVN